MTVRISNLKCFFWLVFLWQIQGCTMVKQDVDYHAQQSNNWVKRLSSSQNESQLDSKERDLFSEMVLVDSCFQQKPTLTFQVGSLNNKWFGPLFLPVIPVGTFEKVTHVNFGLSDLGMNCPKLKISGKFFEVEDDKYSCSYSPEVPLEDFTISFEGKVGECQLPDIQYKLVKKETVIDWFWDFNG